MASPAVGSQILYPPHNPQKCYARYLPNLSYHKRILGKDYAGRGGGILCGGVCKVVIGLCLRDPREDDRKPLGNKLVNSGGTIGGGTLEGVLADVPIYCLRK